MKPGITDCRPLSFEPSHQAGPTGEARSRVALTCMELSCLFQPSLAPCKSATKNNIYVLTSNSNRTTSGILSFVYPLHYCALLVRASTTRERTKSDLEVIDAQDQVPSVIGRVLRSFLHRLGSPCLFQSQDGYVCNAILRLHKNPSL